MSEIKKMTKIVERPFSFEKVAAAYADCLAGCDIEFAHTGVFLEAGAQLMAQDWAKEEGRKFEAGSVYLTTDDGQDPQKMLTAGDVVEALGEDVEEVEPKAGTLAGLTLSQALATGYKKMDHAYFFGYVSRKVDTGAQPVKVAGGTRRGLFFVELPCWQSTAYSLRLYLARP